MNESQRQPGKAEQALRRLVRARLRFVRHAIEYLVLNSAFVLIDWATGGAGSGVNWAQWVALFWGVCLAFEFVAVFVHPRVRDWEHRATDGLVEREIRRRRIDERA